MTAENLASWVGRTERRTDILDLARLNALAATLGDDAPLRSGSPVPPGWHWLYFNPMVPMREVGSDGHPHRGGFLPPIELPRRMWAGGDLTFLQHLYAGEEAQRESEIVAIEEKTGKQGLLVFVTVRHRISAGTRVAIEELQNIVYRNPPPPAVPRAVAAAPEAGEPAPLWRDAYDTSEVMLFRYSALTFNGHRIHYDKDYATREEGYPGLVVHGPLTATMLMRSLVRRAGASVADRPVLKRFTYRGVAPLFVHEPARLEGRVQPDSSWALSARKQDGSEVMSARGELQL